MGKWILLVAGMGLGAAGMFMGERRLGWFSPSDQPTVASTDAETRILATLKQARDSGETFFNIPFNSGKMLRLLSEGAGARNAVEIGTSTGFSALWFCLALQKTGGRLTTFEIDSGRAALARKHFAQAGVADIVTVIEGDAHENVRRLKEPIDVLFLDADKPGYTDYLKTLLPLVRPGGLILADNVPAAEGYHDAVTTNPELETVFVGDFGLTLKKR